MQKTVNPTSGSSGSFLYPLSSYNDASLFSYSWNTDLLSLHSCLQLQDSKLILSSVGKHMMSINTGPENTNIV